VHHDLTVSYVTGQDLGRARLRTAEPADARARLMRGQAQLVADELARGRAWRRQQQNALGGHDQVAHLHIALDRERRAAQLLALCVDDPPGQHVLAAARGVHAAAVRGTAQVVRAYDAGGWRARQRRAEVRVALPADRAERVARRQLERGVP